MKQIKILKLNKAAKKFIEKHLDQYLTYENETNEVKLMHIRNNKKTYMCSAAIETK